MQYTAYKPPRFTQGNQIPYHLFHRNKRVLQAITEHRQQDTLCRSRKAKRILQGLSPHKEQRFLQA